ncbi:MAG: hypothetical protein K2K10_00550 [Acetatifactor sp.]|nr:hypothetical protein [Acetatifactor sp.]
MNWIDEVNTKLKRKNQVLFSKDSSLLQDLRLLLETQNHRTVVLWAFEFAEETVEKLEEKYPTESRPRNALEASELWASGRIKMPIAKREILNCHAFAKEIQSLEDIALCHAIGQACSTVHTSGHALGFPIYDLTAIIRSYGIDHCQTPVEIRKQEYIEKIMYWRSHYESYTGDWADFMLR